MMQTMRPVSVRRSDPNDVPRRLCFDACLVELCDLLDSVPSTDTSVNLSIASCSKNFDVVSESRMEQDHILNALDVLARLMGYETDISDGTLTLRWTNPPLDGPDTAIVPFIPFVHRNYTIEIRSTRGSPHRLHCLNACPFPRAIQHKANLSKNSLLV